MEYRAEVEGNVVLTNIEVQLRRYKSWVIECICSSTRVLFSTLHPKVFPTLRSIVFPHKKKPIACNLYSLIPVLLSKTPLTSELVTEEQVEAQ